MAGGEEEGRSGERAPGGGWCSAGRATQEKTEKVPDHQAYDRQQQGVHPKEGDEEEGRGGEHVHGPLLGGGGAGGAAGERGGGEGREAGHLEPLQARWLGALRGALESPPATLFVCLDILIIVR